MTEYLGGTTAFISSKGRGNGGRWYTVVLTSRMGYPLAMVHTSHRPKVEKYESFVAVDLMVENYTSLYADEVIWDDEEDDDSVDESEDGAR